MTDAGAPRPGGDAVQAPDDLALYLWQQWQAGPEPDALGLLRQAGRLTVPQVVAVLRVDQRERWHRNKPLPAEVYLQWCPALAREPESVLELVYGEYVLREELGQAPAAADHLRRFPQYAARESERIARLFAPAQVAALRGKRATKKELVAHLPGRRVVHTAAHGLADDRFGNRFGALALTPPAAGEEASEDSFLSLHEVYTLPLKDCDCAVLSACVTNVGPQRPLEAGVTLAGGFLAAGARRVVASHGGVDDESTAELMEAFFREATGAGRPGRPPSYARALQLARRAVRGQARWSAPSYWAPFVLVGPPD